MKTMRVSMKCARCGNTIEGVVAFEQQNLHCLGCGAFYPMRLAEEDSEAGDPGGTPAGCMGKHQAASGSACRGCGVSLHPWRILGGRCLACYGAGGGWRKGLSDWLERTRGYPFLHLVGVMFGLALLGALLSGLVEGAAVWVQDQVFGDHVPLSLSIESNIPKLMATRGLMFISFMLGVVVPLLETFLFQFLVLEIMLLLFQGRGWTGMAIHVSALVFALWHLPNLGMFYYLTGLVLAWTYVSQAHESRGRGFLATAVVHGLINLKSIVLVYWGLLG